MCSEFTHPDSKYISAGQCSVCQCAPHCSRVLINTGERQPFVQILLWSAWRRCNYFSLPIVSKAILKILCQDCLKSKPSIKSNRGASTVLCSLGLFESLHRLSHSANRPPCSLFNQVDIWSHECLCEITGSHLVLCCGQMIVKRYPYFSKATSLYLVMYKFDIQKSYNLPEDELSIHQT